MTKPKPVSSLLPTPRSLNDVSSLPIGVLEAEIAARVRVGTPVEVLLPMHSLGNNAADASQVADDWLDAWSFARWIWKTGADLTWSVDKQAYGEGMSPSLRFGIVPGDVLDLARGRMSESIHLVHCPGELPAMVACSVAQYRDDPRETGTVPDEPLAELGGAFRHGVPSRDSRIRREDGRPRGAGALGGARG